MYQIIYGVSLRSECRCRSLHSIYRFGHVRCPSRPFLIHLLYNEAELYETSEKSIVGTNPGRTNIGTPSLHQTAIFSLLLKRKDMNQGIVKLMGNRKRHRTAWRWFQRQKRMRRALKCSTTTKVLDGLMFPAVKKPM